jgi:hypothetical protein
MHFLPYICKEQRVSVCLLLMHFHYVSAPSRGFISPVYNQNIKKGFVYFIKLLLGYRYVL